LIEDFQNALKKGRGSVGHGQHPHSMILKKNAYLLEGDDSHQSASVGYVGVIEAEQGKQGMNL
jgi:hypothetical protein